MGLFGHCLGITFGDDVTRTIFIDLLWDAPGPRAYNWQTAGERFENDVGKVFCMGCVQIQVGCVIVVCQITSVRSKAWGGLLRHDSGFLLSCFRVQVE